MTILEEKFKWHLEAFASELFIYNQPVFMSSQEKYIYIALFTISQIVSKLLHSINQDNLTVFVYSWKKDN